MKDREDTKYAKAEKNMAPKVVSEDRKRIEYNVKVKLAEVPKESKLKKLATEYRKIDTKRYGTFGLQNLNIDDMSFSKSCTCLKFSMSYEGLPLNGQKIVTMKESLKNTIEALLESSKHMNEAGSQPVLSHLLLELTSLSELSFPTTSSSRIKFTSLSASLRYLAVGSSSGSVYLFSRYAFKQLRRPSKIPVKVHPCKDGAVTLLQTSPDEQYIAVAAARGSLNILNISKEQPTQFMLNVLHCGWEITCIFWAPDSETIFTGDCGGRISVTRIRSKISFKTGPEVLFTLDSSIVQIDFTRQTLLVSTKTKTVLCDLNRGYEIGGRSSSWFLRELSPTVASSTFISVCGKDSFF
ncbi:unnamed protein product [Soboliphyme baturini]|uniref:ANAPC4_WD40 domain-containing protein n=1 Tax=Soboliphyme baturini TaxID=241478 RepID=A0A183IQE2_9BILA|nr:unnamed protein product [Soboliphyme baturini]